MVNTSEHPISVDGVRLDTLAWGVTRVNRAVAARRERNVEVPGRDGVIPSLGDDLEPVSFGLEMLVLGTDEDGAVPPEGRRRTFRTNLDELVHLFGKRHSLLDLRETVAPGVERRAWAKVQDAITPDVNATGSSGEVVVGLVLPYGVWEDPEPQTWTQVAPVASASVLTLLGATESIPDAVYAVKGPATNPRITDPATGTWVQLNDTLTTSQVWRLNAATWSTRVGTTLTVDSGDVEGTDKTALTLTGGPQRGTALVLTPVRDAGARRVGVTLSATSGIVDGDTSLTIKAARKYAI
jgi:hypothetical protein